MNISMVMSLVMTAIGFIYTFSTFALPDARIGIPYEPKVFPGVLGICLIAMGFVLIIQEMSKKNKTQKKTSDFFHNEFHLIDSGEFYYAKSLKDATAKYN